MPLSVTTGHDDNGLRIDLAANSNPPSIIVLANAFKGGHGCEDSVAGFEDRRTVDGSVLYTMGRKMFMSARYIIIMKAFILDYLVLTLSFVISLALHYIPYLE